MVQSLRLSTCTARIMGSVPGGQSSVCCTVWPKWRGKKRALFPLYLPGLLLSCLTLLHLGLPGSSAGKEAACNAGDSSYSWVRKTRWRRDRLPTPVSLGFPCGSAGKESAYNVGDLGSIPGLGRSLGEGNGYPLQYSGLENSMHCMVRGVTKSRT